MTDVAFPQHGDVSSRDTATAQCAVALVGMLVLCAAPLRAEPATRPAGPLVVMNELLDHIRACDAGSCLALVANVDDLELQNRLSRLIDKSSNGEWVVTVAEEHVENDVAVVILKRVRPDGVISHEPIAAMKQADGWKLILTSNLATADLEQSKRARQLADRWGLPRAAELQAAQLQAAQLQAARRPTTHPASTMPAR